MNYPWLHELAFYAIYGAIALATFVVVERMIFFTVTLRHARRLVGDGLGSEGATLAAEVLREAREGCARAADRNEQEDITEAIYISTREKLQRHLWILDTIVTAAPLLGLLGTILGIIDTFTALARSGISDPQAVSAGIGTALFATALGIAVALYGLIFHNFFHDRVERIGETIKIILLKATTHETARKPHKVDIQQVAREAYEAA